MRFPARCTEMVQIKHRGITASVIAFAIIAGALYVDLYTLANGLPKADGNSHDAVIMIITAWNGLALNVSSYFFGSSASTDRQSQLLAESSPAQKTTATTAAATITSQPADTAAAQTS